MTATAPPTRTLRLFPASDPPLTLDDHRGYVTGRLLEDGDGEDLRWLFEHLGRERIASWADAHGARRLSRRSRAFWEVVLELEPAATRSTRLGAELWPLA